MMRNLLSLCKRLLCVIVRTCVYTVNFSALQTKGLLSGRNGSFNSRTCVYAPTHFDARFDQGAVSISEKVQTESRRTACEPRG